MASWEQQIGQLGQVIVSRPNRPYPVKISRSARNSRPEKVSGTVGVVVETALKCPMGRAVVVCCTNRGTSAEAPKQSQVHLATCSMLVGMLPLLLVAALAWIPPQDPRFEINGAPWLSENHGELIRLPQRLKDQIPLPVWNLGLSPSGLRIRFRTDSTRVAIKLAYPSPPDMTNMHAFGQTGVDLYVDGVYRSTAIAPKDAAESTPIEHVFFENAPRQEREITIYLPLYKPVKVLGVGLDADAKISKPRRFAVT